MEDRSAMTHPEDGRAPMAMIVCGALTREVHQIAEERGWKVDIIGVPAEHHLYPDRIVEEFFIPYREYLDTVAAQERQVASREPLGIVV